MIKGLTIFFIVFALMQPICMAGRIVSLDLSPTGSSAKLYMELNRVGRNQIMVTTSTGQVYGPFEDHRIRKILATKEYEDAAFEMITNMGIVEILISEILINNSSTKINRLIIYPALVIGSLTLAVGSEYLHRHILLYRLLNSNYDYIATEQEYYKVLYHLYQES